MTCKIESCERPARKRGWCETHYERWRVEGDVDAGRPIGRPGVGKWFDGDDNLPNPWSNEAPPCPSCGESAYLWHSSGSLPWFCPPCRKRFDDPEEVAA